MRLDAVNILLHMGYVLDRDFVAFHESRESIAVKWFATTPQPDDKALDAAAADLAVAQQAEEAKRVESDTARSEAKQAYSELQPLLEHKDPAIALLAVIMQKHLLATLGR